MMSMGRLTFWQIESRWWRSNLGTQYSILRSSRYSHVYAALEGEFDVPDVEMGNEAEFFICCSREPSTNQHVAKVA